MTLLGIVRKNLTKRLLSTSLTIISIFLGVSMVIAVMVVQTETERSFNQTSVGYDLILAAKGSQLQATLNTLYHLETSVGIIPYSLYETAKNDPRVERAFPFYVGDSYRGYRVIGTSEEFLQYAEPRRGQPFQIAEGRFFEGPLEAVLGHETARRLNRSIGDQFYITHGVSEVAPGAEEHVHDELPVTIVGILAPTNTANDRVIFADLYTMHAMHDPQLHRLIHELEEQHEHGQSHDHGNSHDRDHDHDGHGHDHNGHGHDHNNDHGDSHGHSNDHGHDDTHSHGDHNHSHDHDHHHHHHGHVFTPEQVKEHTTLKELDAILVKMVNPAAAIQLSGMINYPTPDNPLLARNMMRDPFFQYKEQIMAVIPAIQISNLMSIVGNAELVLRYVAWFVVIVALMGVLIAIYNTMEERKRDLAVMRALGARKTTIFTIIMLESVVLCFIGALLGLIGGHAIVQLTSPHLAEVAGIVISSFNIDSNQITLIILILGAGVIVGLIPAFKAYRTEVIQNLGSGK